MTTRTVPRPETWTRARRKLDGKPFYIVPGSQPGATYYTAEDGCTCPSAQHSKTGTCKHTRAVLDFERSQRQSPGTEHAATSSPTSWKPCARGCGALLPPEQTTRMCDACFTRIGRALDWIE